MAKNTKGDGSLEQNGSTVVTPDNMGKGLTYNTQTNQYDVALSRSVEIINNQIGLKVSPDTGNLLEVRENGVGLWEVVEPSLQRQYVDSIGGNDNNEGTKNKPLKTVQRALQRLYESKNGGKGQATIMLKNGGTYTIGNQRYNLEQTTLSITRYSDTMDGDTHIDDGYYEYFMYREDKPKLVSQWVEYPYVTNSGTKHGSMTMCMYLNRLMMDGLSVVLEKGELTFPAGTAHFALVQRDVVLRGCDVELKSGILARATQINSQNSMFSLAENTFLTDQFNATYFQSSGKGSKRQIVLGGQTFTVNGDNFEDTPITKFGGRYDVESKRLFGWNANWDVFK